MKQKFNIINKQKNKLFLFHTKNEIFISSKQNIKKEWKSFLCIQVSFLFMFAIFELFFILYSLFYLFYFFYCCTKKLFELPVERDFANEKAFNTAQYPFFFQKFFRIRFFDLEVRFFGTAIIKKFFIVIVGCERHLLFKKTVLYYSLSMY